MADEHPPEAVPRRNEGYRDLRDLIENCADMGELEPIKVQTGTLAKAGRAAWPGLIPGLGSSPRAWQGWAARNSAGSGYLIC